MAMGLASGILSEICDITYVARSQTETACTLFPFGYFTNRTKKVKGISWDSNLWVKGTTKQND